MFNQRGRFVVEIVTTRRPRLLHHGSRTGARRPANGSRTGARRQAGERSEPRQLVSIKAKAETKGQGSERRFVSKTTKRRRPPAHTIFSTKARAERKGQGGERRFVSKTTKRHRPPPRLHVCVRARVRENNQWERLCLVGFWCIVIGNSDAVLLHRIPIVRKVNPLT